MKCKIGTKQQIKIIFLLSLLVFNSRKVKKPINPKTGIKKYSGNDIYLIK